MTMTQTGDATDLAPGDSAAEGAALLHGDAATNLSPEAAVAPVAGSRTIPPASPPLSQVRAHVRRHLPWYLAGLILGAYALTFVRGLWWEWRGLATASRPAPAVVAPRGPNIPAGANGPSRPAANAAPVAAAPKQPLPPTDQPPPRDATDAYGVYYDAQGVAVMGIDTDPGGVYNVPPGRQVRIGGPQGALFDVLPDGKIAPATQVKEQPKP